MYEIAIRILEIIGTVAFAVSGSLVAIGKKLDLFGVLFLGCITAVGGGMLRDVLIGQVPPRVFSDSIIIVIAALTAILVFVFAYVTRSHFSDFTAIIETVNNVFDALGLSLFSVLGTEIACKAGYDNKILFCLLMGMTTGVGGGIFRDVLANTVPYVLKKHIYALASLAGCTVYFVMRKFDINTTFGAAVAMTCVFVIRMLATRYHWKLPRAEG